MPIEEIAETLIRGIRTGEFEQRREEEDELQEDPTQLKQLADAVNQGPPLPAADIRLGYRHSQTQLALLCQAKS